MIRHAKGRYVEVPRKYVNIYPKIFKSINFVKGILHPTNYQK